MSTAQLLWSEGAWLNPPPQAVEDGEDLVVTAAKGSDLWRITSYGFERHSGHALLGAFRPEWAIEVSFTLDYDHLYDQAGLLIRVDAETWIKAGVEISDGQPQLSVVAGGRSDWSAAPVPQWSGQTVTIRASWSGDAVTIRGRVADSPWQMARLTPLDPDATAYAGPYCCAPEREGLTVRFHSWSGGPADLGLHEGPPEV